MGLPHPLFIPDLTPSRMPSHIHGLVRDTAGNIATFDGPGVGTQIFAGTFPVAISSNGEVAGYYWDDHCRLHAFLTEAEGNVSNADVPGAFETFVSGMNDLARLW